MIKLNKERKSYHANIAKNLSKRDNFKVLDITKEDNSSIADTLSMITGKKVISLKNGNISKSKNYYIKEPAPVLYALEELNITNEECDQLYIERLI